ncbi:unnamed protein product [Diatraea saccharalis]|uniref:Peptidase M14 domain-containing protein n=1 Tax=Diatraea saccharalis TaxID=40085 RepID=A0A9N9WHU9_9NEOP|nr:unnamed protein product [Diatraea saccharalis]
MIQDLKTNDEATCISDAAIGASTITIFLKAIEKYCPNITEIHHDKQTYEGRLLYEVLITNSQENGTEDDRPVILIDAGQEAGTDSVGFALFLIEQLVSCEENDDMITNVRWNRVQWRKNLSPFENGIGYGVDISRNFEGEWKACPSAQSPFSSTYPGPSAGSENETQFIQEVLTKYRKDAKMYISLRRDGHSLNYPYGYESSFAVSRPKLEKVATMVAAKVNQRAGSVHLFTNQSIFDLNGKAYCGHSVDYAHQQLSIPYAFEMRVFLGSENVMLSKFQTLPKGYETNLRNGYYSGIRELYNILIKNNQYRFF